MRWDRLFTELAAGIDDEGDRERDALAEDLAAEEWAGLDWRRFLVGAHAIEVRGVGRIDGKVHLANHEVVLVGETVAVAAAAVMAVLEPGQPTREIGRVERSLGWRHVLRAFAEDGPPVRVERADGIGIDGLIDAVGADFVRLRSDGGAIRMIPFDALVAVRALM